MKNWRHLLLKTALAGTVLATLAVIVFVAVPGVLSTHQLSVRRVRAQFTNEQERTEKMAQAAALDEPVFDVLYEQLGDGKVIVYLPPRDSFAHSVVGLFAALLRVEKEVAAREDILAAPPAPEALVYLDESSKYPMQASAVSLFVHSFQAGAAVVACVLGALSLLLWRTGKRVRVQTMQTA